MKTAAWYRPDSPGTPPICGATARAWGLHTPLVYGEVQNLRRHGEPYSHFDGRDERCILREMLPWPALWDLKPQGATLFRLASEYAHLISSPLTSSLP
jgi:hypothetical protein